VSTIPLATRSAAAVVRRWADWYSRGLPAATAEERRSELASDVHEQLVEASGDRPVQTSVSLLGRTVRGVPDDLLWRGSVLRGLPAAERLSWRRRVADRRVTGLTVLCGTMMTAWCLFVLTRVSISVDRGDIDPGSSASALLIAFAAICCCGTIMSARPRTRLLGAGWLAVASQVILHLGLYALYSTSATVGSLTFALPGWNSATTLLSLGLGALCLGSAVWSLPEGPRRSSPLPLHRTDPQ
jgi:hypothetical protein